MAFTRPDLGNALPLIASGKVRELYQIDGQTLLFVASDRISAYDRIMKNGVPGKGKVLTQMTAFWFDLLKQKIPNLKVHLLTTDIPPQVPAQAAEALRDRSMVVRKLKIFKVEAIVRGYITGSAWSSYKKTGEVNGVKIDSVLQESQKFPTPLYTPSTKAELGEHDENISIEQAVEIVGEKYAKRIEDLAIQIYTVANDYAQSKGLILADTKFEFGLDEETDEVVLVDEVLTPDSSRFWSLDNYQVGRGQESFDKQFLRDWLTENGLKGKEGIEMPTDIAEKTGAKYREAYQKLTGKTIS